MIIEDFLNYLRYERNRSELTVKSYSEDLSAFELYFKNLDNHLSWESVDSDIIRSWMESMMDKGNIATSINRRLSALRSLYRFALSKGYVDRNPVYGVSGPKNKKPLPQFVKEREMDRLFGLPIDESDFKTVRARTIILMFYETGVRLSELVGMDDGGVDFINRQVKVAGKRNKQRIVPFGEELFHALKSYMALRDEVVARRSEALFVTLDGG
ncbi:MAG TPA: site-specific integrase, partial [Prevotella sp.]